jgi:acyl-CoA synthetase (AMP-forming)/AMP-acid ligase II
LNTVAARFARSAALFPEHPWLQVLPETARANGTEARTWTYAQAAKTIEHLRAGYRAAGLGHGHRAGLLLLNSAEFLCHWIALNELGVSIVPINAESRATELEYLIEHSEIRMAACTGEGATRLTAAASAVGRALPLCDRDGMPPGGVRPGSIPAAPLSGQEPGLRTECALLYTSGTTGRPKGCVLSNEYFLWAGEWYARVGGLCEIRPGAERMITPLPLTHMNALAVSTMCMMQTGGCLILLDRFHPRTYWDSVRTSQATIIHYLGVMPAMLLDAPEALDDRHAVRFGFGAGVNARHHQRFEQRFGFPLVEAWAMTETGAGAVVIANHEPRHIGTACFGRAEPEVECRLVGESGTDVGVGEPGELWVRRAGARPDFGLFSGYLKDKPATDEAWAGGWFHTGDVVTRDAEGCFRFVDRKKNVIRRSGENIAALEVEAVLSQHPAIAAVGVSAVPDDTRGDEVFASVVLRDPEKGRPEELALDIVRFCLERLTYFKVPGYVAFCENLPLTPTAKIQRGELRQLGLRLLNESRCVDLRDHKRRTR